MFKKIIIFLILKIGRPILIRYPEYFKTSDVQDDILLEIEFIVDGVIGSMAILCVITIFTFLHLDIYSRISIVLFSISIPCLSLGYLTYLAVSKHKKKKVITKCSCGGTYQTKYDYEWGTPAGNAGGTKYEKCSKCGSTSGSRQFED